MITCVSVPMATLEKTVTYHPHFAVQAPAKMAPHVSLKAPKLYANAQRDTKDNIVK